MSTRNLNQHDLYNILQELTDHTLTNFKCINKELYYYIDTINGKYLEKENILQWLQQDYLNDWGFVKSIDHLEFYYDKSGNPAATIEYTINWIYEDDTEIAVSKLARGDKGWAVLIFYGDELTLVKKDLYEYEAHDLCTELSTDLSDWNITELIRSEGFEKYD